MSFKSYSEYRQGIKKYKDRTDAHHCMPIQIPGSRDIKENIATVLSVDHIPKIHQVLDIPYKKWHKLLREYREKTGGTIALTQDMVQHQIDIQQEYFQNINKLEPHFIDMHTIKMGELAHFEADQLKRITNEMYKIDMTCFETIHESYAEIRRTLAREIYDAIRKKIYPQ